MPTPHSRKEEMLRGFDEYCGKLVMQDDNCGAMNYEELIDFKEFVAKIEI